MASDDGIDGENDLPIIRNLSGLWTLDSSRSDSLDALFAAMGVPWLARKLVNNARITVQILQDRDTLILSETSVYGTFSTSLVLDGKARPVVQIDRVPKPMRCRWKHDEALLSIETVFPNGTLSDCRNLVKRTEYRQVLTFQGVTATRFFTKVETEEEKKSAELAEDAARMALAYQAATMSLLHPASLPEDAEEEKPEPETPTKSPKASEASGEAASTPGAATASEEVPLYARTCDFSGSWVLDRSRSDTLDPMLTLMGLPWIARKM
jgi:hypothetical protein